MGISAMLAAGVVGFYQAMAMTVHQDQDQDPGDTSKADKADKAAACSALYDGPAFKVSPTAIMHTLSIVPNTNTNTNADTTTEGAGRRLVG